MTSGKQQLDGEINIKVLGLLTIGLLVLVALAMVLMWFLTTSLYEQEKAEDPPPPLMIEARVPHLPPNPRLQSEPFFELDLLRATQNAQLNSYGWVDESTGLAHIPIDRAMDLLVVNGLPTTPVVDESIEEQPGDGR
jgi:hypothetical protein